MLPHRCVTANIDAIDAALELDYDLDRAVSWLPLYHDMGLIGMLMIPMTTGTDLVLAGPQDFLAAPSRWAQWISDFHCSITAGPNFSVRAVRPRDAPRRRPGPEPVARRAERRRADRAELGRGLAGRGRPARPAGRHRVLRLRHGRVDRRHHLPRAGQGHDRRRGRQPGARDRPLRRRRWTRRSPAPGGCRSSGRRSRAWSCGSWTRHRHPAARPRGRRARGARDVGDARVLPQRARHRGRVPRRVVAHRRPRLPRRRRARSSAAGSRTSSSSAAATCSPRTSSAPRPRRRRRARRQRHRVRYPGRQGRESVVVVAETRADDAEPVRDAVSTRVHRRGRRLAPRSCSCGPARCPRRRRASSSARSARPATSTTSSNPSRRSGRALRRLVAEREVSRRPGRRTATVLEIVTARSDRVSECGAPTRSRSSRWRTAVRARLDPPKSRPASRSRRDAIVRTLGPARHGGDPGTRRSRHHAPAIDRGRPDRGCRRRSRPPSSTGIYGYRPERREIARGYRGPRHRGRAGARCDNATRRHQDGSRTRSPARFETRGQGTEW